MRTAESVSPSHPDKLCDRISDAVLDACLEQDPLSRVAIETMGGHGKVFVTGELTTKADIDVLNIVAKTLGRNTPPIGIHTNIVRQSPEIAQGVDTGGAGDQGIMIGYATSETPELMPLEVMLARRLNRFIYESKPYDGKTQITLDKGKVTSVVASFQRVPQQTLVDLIDEFF
jgi:S-adenosylmethionine synthetase